VRIISLTGIVAIILLRRRPSAVRPGTCGIAIVSFVGLLAVNIAAVAAIPVPYPAIPAEKAAAFAAVIALAPSVIVPLLVPAFAPAPRIGIIIAISAAAWVNIDGAIIVLDIDLGRAVGPPAVRRARRARIIPAAAIFDLC
jgi:hypothetical protein